MYVSCQFSLFEDITKDEVEPKLEGVGVEIHTVESDTQHEDEKVHRGLRVNCNGTKCIFEFRMFRYIGDRVAPSDSAMRRRTQSAPTNAQSTS